MKPTATPMVTGRPAPLILSFALPLMLLGVLLLGTIDNGLAILGVSSYWKLVVKGLILIFAVFVDVIRGGEKYE